MGSNNQACFSPYRGRPHFKMGLEGYTDASAKPMLTTLKHLMDSNTSLVFIGDSTMRQKLNALDCELMREDRRIKMDGTKWGIVPCYTLLKIKLPKNLIQLGGKHHGLVLDLHGVAMGPSAVECLKGMDVISFIFCLNSCSLVLLLLTY